MRIPCDLWGWRNTCLVLLALLAPLAALLGPIHDAGVVPTVTVARTILVAAATLAAAALLYAHGRLTDNDQSRWVAAALAIAATSGLASGGYALTHLGDVRRAAGVVLLVAIGVALTTLVLVLLATRPGLPVHPAVVALLGSLVAVVAQQLLVTRAGALRGDDLVAGLTVLLCAVNLAVAAAYLRLDALPGWVRTRSGAATVLLAVGASVGAPVSDSPVEAAVALGCGLVGGVVLAGTAAALLRLAIQEEEHAVAALQRRLHAAEAERRADQTRFHEINTLVAGIASANQLIADIPATERREGLITMMHAELDRLQRLLADRSAAREQRAGKAGSEPGSGPIADDPEVDLDSVVGRMVLAHRARGRDVQWQPSGLRARGRSDHVAEVLDVLLENAALHGSPYGIEVTVTGSRPDGVDVAVSDSGAGVAPELRDRIFDWGVHGPHSPGHGIGLYAAATLALADGGELRLDDPGARGGARFVLHLPGPPLGAQTRDALVHSGG